MIRRAAARSSARTLLIGLLLAAGCSANPTLESAVDRTEGGRYPAHWWEEVAESDAAWWEILPQAAGHGEVILSKRNELGLLSNFASTPFVFRGVRYASLEGLWQSMKYPESSDDPRAHHPGVDWEHSREEVAGMVAFEAHDAGEKAEKNMRVMGIDWVTFEGETIRFKGPGQGRHYEIIEAATRAKVHQNPRVREVVLATGELTLRPDHLTDEDAPPAWRYFDIYMKIRRELSRREHRPDSLLERAPLLHEESDGVRRGDQQENPAQPVLPRAGILGANERGVEPADDPEGQCAQEMPQILAAAGAVEASA
jgi:predicted NAD-dependent protein-ADP-ribosyltransferase YbiA (DUF1768 family)